MGKLQTATDSIKELVSWFLGAFALATIGYCVFEHVTPWDAIWWSWVTGSTTGYGDIYPHTVGGRIVAILLMTFMFVWGCVFTARLASHMIVNNDAWTHNEQEQIKADLQAIRNLLNKEHSNDNH